jgi:hypothetical protein
MMMLLAILALAVPALAQTKKKDVPPATPEGMKAPLIEAANIQIMRPSSDEVRLPDDFRMAIYEKVVADLEKSGRFQHVYRDGETPSEDANKLGVVKMEIIVWGFKEGSARKRQVTTVAGETRINVRARATDPSGKELMDRNVQGSVHFFGENLAATDTLAANVSKLIKSMFKTGMKPVKVKAS